MLDDLFTYRLGPERFLTVTNASNHARDLAWFQQHAGGLRRRRSHDRLADFAMLAVQGPQARGDRRPGSPTASCPARFRTAELHGRRRARRARLRHRLHGRGRRRAAASRPSTRRAVWDALVGRGRRPAGLGARDTLRLEVCFHLYGNDLSEERGPIEAGLGWCCKEDTGFIGADAVRARARGGPGREARPLRAHRARASRARATRSWAAARSRAARCRRASASAIGMAYVPGRRAPSPARRSRSTCAARPRAAEVRAKPLYTQGDLSRGRGQLPDDLKYHPEHDWARIDGDIATFGITWYAQDQLGEVVFFDPPEVGATVTKDEPYAEVESVKAVSDVIAPLSGEIVEVNDGARRTRPRRSTTTPTARAGWSRSGSRDPAEVDALMDAAAYRGRRSTEPMSRYTSATDADRRAMLAAIGVGSIDELFADVPEGVRLGRPLDLPPGKPEQEVYALPARARRAQRLHRGRGLVPRRRDVRPLRPGARSTRSSRARSS